MWVTNEPLFSAAVAKDQLKLYLLETRRKKFRLKLIHTIYHCQTGTVREKYLLPPHCTSKRTDHAFKVREYFCKTQSFRSSFFPPHYSRLEQLALWHCIGYVQWFVLSEVDVTRLVVVSVFLLAFYELNDFVIICGVYLHCTDVLNSCNAVRPVCGWLQPCVILLCSSPQL